MKSNYLLRPRIARRTLIALAAAALLVGSMLAALGAGPDDTAGATASNTDGRWQTFEGHAFANSRIVPEGFALMACLGGCDGGYVSEPVVIGQDGWYSGLKVAPDGADRSALPNADAITFWLVGRDDRVRAEQSWLFTGNGQTEELHLDFRKLPLPTSGVGSSGAPAAVTTDLTVPDTDELGLAPARTPRSYINSWSYAGVPVLPGLTVLTGMVIAIIGVALLVHRRRLTW